MLHSRLARVTELIKNELGEVLDRELSNPLIPEFTTVHSVKVSKDLRSAVVFVTFLKDDDPKEIEVAIKELNKSAGFIRNELGRRITLRYLPHLKFHYNPSTHYAADLEKVFNKIHENEQR